MPAPSIAPRKNSGETEAPAVLGSTEGSVVDNEREPERANGLFSFGEVPDAATVTTATADAERDEALDRLTEEVRVHFDVAWACVSLVDLERQWFKSIASAAPHVGNELGCFSEMPRKDSLCAHIIDREGDAGLFVVADALKDARFRERCPLVTGPPHVRFYAGTPLVDGDGFRIGALCLLDTKPGALQLTAAQEEVLQTNAGKVSKLLSKSRENVQQQTLRKRASSSNLSNYHAEAVVTTETSKAVDVEPKKVTSPHTSMVNLSSIDSALEPVKFSSSSSSCNKTEEYYASEAAAKDNNSGKRSRTNSPERNPSDIIVKPQQQLLLPSPKTDSNTDPDDFLVQLVTALYPGVQLKIKPALELEAFFPIISEEQMARYNMQVVNMARANDVAGLKQFHADHGGRDNNVLDCFNRFGEGLLNMACRRGFTEMVDFLLSPCVGLNVRVRDDYGRTPLHDACWNPEPQLEICTWIMQKDPSLFLVADKRGFTPFQYARKSDWPVWRQFLVDNLDHLHSLARPEITTVFSEQRHF